MITEITEITVNDQPTFPQYLEKLHPDNIRTLTREEIPAFIESIRLEMMKGEQIELPVNHHFAKGEFAVYGRELPLPKGSLIIGKIHKHECMSIITRGEVSILSIDGAMRVKAPFTFVSSPGAQRLIYAHEDTVWMTVHGTKETNIEKLEADLVTENYDDVRPLFTEEKLCLSCGQE